jgi:O-acetylserine/cysteine efflux transporter
VTGETADRRLTTASRLGALDVAVLLMMQVVWGGGLIASKIGVDEMPPLLFSALRYMLVSALLFPLLGWHRGQMPAIALAALLTGTLNLALTNSGLWLAQDVAPAAIAIQLAVPFATLLSVIFLRERLGVWRIGALIVSFSGVLVVGLDPAVAGDRTALLLVVAGALSMASGVIFMRRIHGVPVYQMQAWLALFSWPPLLCASLLIDGSPVEPVLGMSSKAIASVAWMVLLAGLVGQAAHFWAVQRHEISLMAPFMLLSPVLGAAGGALLLGDVITWRLVLGGCLTLGGVLIITLRENRDRTSALHGLPR